MCGSKTECTLGKDINILSTGGPVNNAFRIVHGVTHNLDGMRGGRAGEILAVDRSIEMGQGLIGKRDYLSQATPTYQTLVRARTLMDGGEYMQALQDLVPFQH